MKYIWVNRFPYPFIKFFRKGRFKGKPIFPMTRTLHERVTKFFHLVQSHLNFTRALFLVTIPFVTCLACAKSTTMFWSRISASSKTFLGSSSTGFGA